MTVHPLSMNALQALPAWLAPVRFAAAQETVCLPLLPLGPDGVQQRLLAQDPTFIAARVGQTPKNATSRGNSTPLSGLRVQGTASSPSSTVKTEWPCCVDIVVSSSYSPTSSSTEPSARKGLAERVGFEPTMDLRPYALSRRAP